MMRQLLWIPALLIVAASLTSGSDDSQADKRGAAVTQQDTPGKNRGSARLRAPRIEPVKKESWTAAQRELLEPYEQAGRLLNVFTTMANHPDLARDWLTFATHVLRRNSLPARDREILILRIGWLCGAEYEWAQHVRLAKGVGMTDDDIRRVSQGPDAPGLSDHERLLIRAADELRDDAFLSDTTWNALAKTYDTRQMMDLVFTVGQYNLVSMALNSFGVQLEPGVEGFPQ
jgi:4-carboxymuconolactone decarboxylase